MGILNTNAIHLLSLVLQFITIIVFIITFVKGFPGSNDGWSLPSSIVPSIAYLISTLDQIIMTSCIYIPPTYLSLPEEKQQKIQRAIRWKKVGKLIIGGLVSLGLILSTKEVEWGRGVYTALIVEFDVIWCACLVELGLKVTLGGGIVLGRTKEASEEVGGG